MGRGDEGTPGRGDAGKRGLWDVGRENVGTHVNVIGSLTNRMWFSVVCTLIDSDTRHHSGQNVVDSRGAAE